MTERLLQYIWQFQYFNSGSLQTVQGQVLQVLQPGTHNTNQGPDFLNAKVKIGETIWAGSIELHINSSDWKLHNHTGDKNYKNVILHVVLNNDVDLHLPFPTLELNSRISKLLLKQYEGLMQSQLFIPCQNQLHTIDPLTINAWKERLLIERLQRKAINIESFLEKNNHHWEETLWWMLARNFGIKINADAFEKIVQSISINILAKHKNQIHQLEALLFGQAGLLDKTFTEDYPNMLKKEYEFLKQKYELQKLHLPIHFLRMRPANFPTIRLAQLAALINESVHLFSKIKEADSLKVIEELFTIAANDYWHYHYILDEESAFKKKTLGKQMIQNILINTVVPILYAYGYFNNEEAFKNKALNWMEQIVSEKNNITRNFEDLNVENKTAFDSQALIQLKNEYCNDKRCLQCAIGNKLLKGA